MQKYKWNKKDFYKIYKQILVGRMHFNKSNRDQELDRAVILYLITSKLCNSFHINNLKETLIDNENYVKYWLTSFQKDQIKKYLDTASILSQLDIDSISSKLDDLTNNELLDHIYGILSQISHELLYFIKDELANNSFNISRSKKTSEEAAIYNRRFYKINRNKEENPVVDFLHELMHGYLDKKTNRKFDKNKMTEIYEEAASTLIELYSSDYLLDNSLIDINEYIYILNRLLARNITNDIDQIKTLFEFADLNGVSNNKKNLKAFFKFKENVNKSLILDYKQAKKYQLSSILKYFYSTILALAIYDKYPDNAQLGIKAIVKFIENVTPENEAILYKDYDLDEEKALSNMIQKHNTLVKKHLKSYHV